MSLLRTKVSGDLVPEISNQAARRQSSSVLAAWVEALDGKYSRAPVVILQNTL